MSDTGKRNIRDAVNLDYVVLASGSSGNAVRIENIMIDCGIPFSKMKKELYKCNTLLITHVHSDHLKRQTYERILKEFPRIKTYGNAEVAYSVPVGTVIAQKPFKVGDKTITPFPGTHDAEVTCFCIEDSTKAIYYATDTAEAPNPDKRKYDYIFLESNYDENKLREVAKLFKHKGYDPELSAHRHLSTQKCKAFFYQYRKSKESQLIELHKSKRFY